MFAKATMVLVLGVVLFFVGALAGIGFERARSATREAERVTALEEHVAQLEQRLLARGPVRTRQQDWEEMKARMERMKAEHPEKFAQMESRRTGLRIIRKKRADRQTEKQ